MPDLETLQTRLGYTFREVALLQLALTHPSVSNEQASASLLHNQRLEFLGDSVLSLVLTHELYEKFPGVGEGPLTKARAQMVNRRTLAEQARRLDLGDYLMLSRGEESHGGRQKESALADAFEALLGAIFIDAGYDIAREFVLRSFRDGFGELTAIPNLENPKGELQEMLQATSSTAPQYELATATGPDHNPIFECVVIHVGQELGRGFGKSKKMAESAAAVEALLKLKK
ncbi:MAG: ribonuclease III [Limisphaerales bacterium]